jgi:hypothetical protein
MINSKYNETTYQKDNRYNNSYLVKFDMGYIYPPLAVLLLYGQLDGSLIAIISP